MTDTYISSLIAELEEWRDDMNAHNPSYSMNLGSKSFSADQIIEHIKKDTEDGKMLVSMLTKYSVYRFKKFLNKPLV